MCDKVKVNEKRNNKMYNQLLNDIVIFNNILLEKMLLLKTTYSDDSVNIFLDKIIKILEPVN